MLNLSLATVVQHLLFFFLVVVTPIWDYYDTRRLKQNPESGRKLRYYRTLMAWLWIASLLACLAVGFRALFTIEPCQAKHPGCLGMFGCAPGGSRDAIFMALLCCRPSLRSGRSVTKQPRKYSSADALEVA